MRVFKVWDPDQMGEEDARTQSALDHEDAAQEFAEKQDWRDADGPSEERTVCVKDTDGNVKRMLVTAHATVYYRAKEIA